MRLGEGKVERRRRKKPQDENIMSASAAQAAGHEEVTMTKI